MTDDLAIGVDLGATKIATALVTSQGQVIGSHQVPTVAARGSQAVIDLIGDEINALLANVSGKIAGIGIGTPGTISPSDGVVRNAVNLGWTEVPLVSGVRSKLAVDLPIWIQKDTNASALGEYYFGSARGYPDFVYLSLGSGLGGGVIANGQIINGAGWQSSELGHFSLDTNGRLCACGLRGCAETVVSGPGLLAVTRELLAAGIYPTSLNGSARLSPASILTAAQENDALARAALDEVGRELGIVMAVCVAVLNPAIFVIGGGLGLAAFNQIVPASRRELEQRVTDSSIHDLQIIPSALTSSAIGPSCLVWYNLDPQINRPALAVKPEY